MKQSYYTVYFIFVLFLGLSFHSVLIEKYHLSTVLASGWYTLSLWVCGLCIVVAGLSTLLALCILSDDNERNHYLKSHCVMMKDYILPQWTIWILFAPIAGLIQLESYGYAAGLFVIVLGLWMFRHVTVLGYKLIAKEMIKK